MSDAAQSDPNTLHKAWALLEAMLAAPAGDANFEADRAIARSMIGSGIAAVRAQVPERVARLAAIASDPAASARARANAWSHLSRHATSSRRTDGTRIGRWAGVLALDGGA